MMKCVCVCVCVCVCARFAVLPNSTNIPSSMLGGVNVAAAVAIPVVLLLLLLLLVIGVVVGVSVGLYFARRKQSLLRRIDYTMFFVLVLLV